MFRSAVKRKLREFGAPEAEIIEQKSKDILFKRELDKLECPFTWDMGELSSIKIIDEDIGGSEDGFLVIHIINKMVTLYVLTNQGVSEKELNRHLDDCVTLMKNIGTESLIFSVPTVNYIYKATRCFVLWSLRKKEVSRLIMEEIKEIMLLQNLCKSTLNGCKGIAWSRFYKISPTKAIEFFKNALLNNKENFLWNFLLAKNLRRARRETSIEVRPEYKEQECFIKAYDYSKNAHIGIFTAQMYRECGNKPKALEIYDDIFENEDYLKGTGCCRLAIGYMNLNNFNNARKCLDKAREINSLDSMYLHYEGVYYLKTHNHGKALEFFKLAAERHNYPAARQYASIMIEINNDFDTAEYLLHIKKQYTSITDSQNQTLLLDVAISYYLKRDPQNTLKYFLDAILINPGSGNLRRHESVFKKIGRQINIYQILKKVLNLITETMLTDKLTQMYYSKLQQFVDEADANLGDL